MESLPAQIVADSIICACVTVKRYACSIARICECADGATAESEIERSEGADYEKKQWKNKAEGA